MQGPNHGNQRETRLDLSDTVQSAILKLSEGNNEKFYGINPEEFRATYRVVTPNSGYVQSRVESGGLG